VDPLANEVDIDLFRKIEAGEQDIAFLVLQTPAGYKGLRELAEGLRSGELDPKGIIKDWDVFQDQGLVKLFLDAADEIAYVIRCRDAFVRSLELGFKWAPPKSDWTLYGFSRNYRDELVAQLPYLRLDRGQLHRMERRLGDWWGESRENGDIIEGILGKLWQKDLGELSWLLPRPDSADDYREDKLNTLSRWLPDLDMLLECRRCFERLERIHEESGMYPEDIRSVLRLIRDARMGIDEAKRGLVEANLGLVGPIAREYSTKWFPFEDLMRVGAEELAKAADSFDFTRGLGFSDYAKIWVGLVLSKASAKAISPEYPFSRRQKNACGKAEALLALMKTRGRKPTSVEMAGHMGLTAEKPNGLPAEEA
jgi:hypothetical protein